MYRKFPSDRSCVQICSTMPYNYSNIFKTELKTQILRVGPIPPRFSTCNYSEIDIYVYMCYDIYIRWSPSSLLFSIIRLKFF